MDLVDGMNPAIDYMEENLTGQVSLARAAQTATCSEFHFQRMFAFITGVTPLEYLRRRRMTMAALEMIEGRGKIIDLAYKYGYDSPTAFNRAFQSIHGLAPSQARQQGVLLTAFPRIAFTLSIRGKQP